MKQTILALIRPELNLSQPENQRLHLIEHILLSSERNMKIGITQDKFAKDILSSGGYITELFCAEYYVVRSSAADSIKKIILSSSNNLHLEKVDLPAMKNVLIHELDEKKSQEIGIGEQFEKTIYHKKSPALKQPWFEKKELINLGKNKTDLDKIFKKYNSNQIFLELTFDEYNISKKISIKKNILSKTPKTINLTHPYQSPESSSINILLPKKLDENDLNKFLIYRTLLTDYYFGILYKEMREIGLIYDISINYNKYFDSIQIYFSCSKNNTSEALNFIQKFVEKDEIVSEKYLDLVKEKISTNYELDWGDITNNSLFYIEEALLSKFYISPKERVEKIKRVSSKEINDFHKGLRAESKNNLIITILNYGKKAEKMIDKK
ncbi:MAG: hypothetical protein NTW79_02290 [Candidatus Berkelbacteria bacterium]|nr:hypothetical protein [Candidatus Berkelbacteria bacterium]